MASTIVPASAIPSPLVLDDAILNAEMNPDGESVFVFGDTDGTAPNVTAAQLFLVERILAAANEKGLTRSLRCPDSGSVYDQALTFGAPVASAPRTRPVSDDEWATVRQDYPAQRWLPKPLVDVAEAEAEALAFASIDEQNATVWWLLRDVRDHNCTLRAEAVVEVSLRFGLYIDPNNAFFSTAAKNAIRNQLSYELERAEQTFLEGLLFVLLIVPLAGNVPMQSPIVSLAGLCFTPLAWSIIASSTHLWASITTGTFRGVTFACLFWIVFVEQVRTFVRLLLRYRLRSFSLWLDMSDEFLLDERAFADEAHVRRLLNHNEPAPFLVKVREVVTRTPVRVLAGLAGIVYVSTSVAISVSSYAVYVQSSQPVYDGITALFHHWAADAILFVVIPIVRPILIVMLGIFFPLSLVGLHLRTFLRRAALYRRGKMMSSFQAPFFLAMFYLGYTWVQALGSMVLLVATCIILTVGITAIVLSPSLASHVAVFLQSTVLSSIILHTLTTAASRAAYWSPSYPRKVLRNPRLFALQDSCTSAVASGIMGPTVLMLRLLAHCVYFVIDFGRVDVSTTRGSLRSFDLPYASFSAVVGIHRLFGNPTANHFVRVTMGAAAQRVASTDDVRRRRIANRFWLCILLHKNPMLISMRAAAIAEARQPSRTKRIVDAVSGAVKAGATATASVLHVPLPRAPHISSRPSYREEGLLIRRHRRSRSRRRAARKPSVRGANSS